MLFFSLNTSFPKIFKIKEIGVNTVKNIKHITKGETIFPKIIPIFIHNLFNGNKIDEFKNPSIKKIPEIINDQYFIFPESR